MKLLLVETTALETPGWVDSVAGIAFAGLVFLASLVALYLAITKAAICVARLRSRIRYLRETKPYRDRKKVFEGRIPDERKYWKAVWDAPDDGYCNSVYLSPVGTEQLEKLFAVIHRELYKLCRTYGERMADVECYLSVADELERRVQIIMEGGEEE